MKLTLILFLSAIRCLWQRQRLEDWLYLISNHVSFAVIVRLLPRTPCCPHSSQLLAWLSCVAGMLFLKTWELVLVSQQFQLVPRASLKLFWGLCSKTLQAVFNVEITGRLSPLALTGLHWGAVTPDIWSWVSSQAQLLRSSTAIAVQTQNFPCYVFPGLAPAVS